jgi:tetratricopeptide (TPR) repeat protein
VAPDDRELAAKVYSVLLDALARLGPLEQTDQSFGAELAAMRQTLEQGNAGPESRRALGRLYLLRGELPAARSLYEEAGASFPQAAWPLVGLARLALDAPAPDLQEADRLLALAFGLPANQEGGAWSVPDRRDAFYLRGKVKTAAGDFTGAQADFNKALEISPSWEPAALGLAYLQEQAGAPTKA